MKGKILKISRARLKEKLEELYRQYNQRAYVAPDPLLFLYDYPRVKDREIAGLIASSLAYGRVSMIMATVKSVLDRLGPDLHGAVTAAGERELARLFSGFRYRFASENHITALILGIQAILREHGSIESCFLAGMSSSGCGESVHQGLAGIYRTVNSRAGGHIRSAAGHLLADPEKSSACKRSHLFLRWMVRQDGVDPGGWSSVTPSCLVVPIDTHMYRIGSLLGFTRRKAADRACALEITRGFSQLVPDDPVRYDFALTRFGIRQEFDLDDLKSYLAAKDS